MKLLFRALVTCVVISFISIKAKSQTKPALFDGTFVAGYVDNGAYVNFTGPSLKYIKNRSSIALSLLPGLRIKEDKVAANATKNSVITPSLGFGLTASVKHLAFQLPLYYDPKTALKNGSWHLGVGLGFKL